MVQDGAFDSLELEREAGADQLVKTAIGITLLAMLIGLGLRLRRHRLTAAATPSVS